MARYFEVVISEEENALVNIESVVAILPHGSTETKLMLSGGEKPLIVQHNYHDVRKVAVEASGYGVPLPEYQINKKNPVQVPYKNPNYPDQDS